MASRLRVQFEGGIYHVTFRGNARQRIFKDDGDRLRLRCRMEEAVEDFGVRLYPHSPNNTASSPRWTS
jgi:putative transposase